MRPLPHPNDSQGRSRRQQLWPNCDLSWAGGRFSRRHTTSPRVSQCIASFVASVNNSDECKCFFTNGAIIIEMVSTLAGK
jgi:hypothetical protein